MGAGAPLRRDIPAGLELLSTALTAAGNAAPALIGMLVRATDHLAVLLFGAIIMVQPACYASPP